jgi:hypothetical protein
MVGVDAVEEPAPEKRIGDRERREVDSRLQQAHADGVLTLTEYDERSAQCWAARTRSELDVLVRDLPDPPPPAQARPPVATAPAPTTRSRSGRVVRAALATAAVLAVVQIATADDAVAVFSGRTVQVVPGQDRVEVGVLFGSVEVVVSDDARVDTDGLMVFGGTDCEAACNGTGTRVITVESRGAFGSVDVVRQGERTADRHRDRNRDRDDDD